MILYFTGTGNSKFVADALADKLKDQTASIGNIIKHNKEKTFKSKKPYVIVCPVYAWNLPKIVTNFIERASFHGNDKVYLIVTMGSSCGNCDENAKKIFANKCMNYMGCRGVVMPDNYVPFSVMPQWEEVKSTIRRALPQIFEIADIIKKEQKLTSTKKKTLLDSVLSKTVNKAFTTYFVSDSNYVVDEDSCDSCSLCEKLCPVNNIVMKDGKPTFNGNCISCFACLHHCPSMAIDIKGKTENNGRYVCPEYKTVKIE